MTPASVLSVEGLALLDRLKYASIRKHDDAAYLRYMAEYAGTDRDAFIEAADACEAGMYRDEWL